MEDDDGAGGNGRLWRTVIIGEQEHRIDMQVIRPYLRVVSHGGRLSQTANNSFAYLKLHLKVMVFVLLCQVCMCDSAGYYGEGLNAIIVFTACYLPDSSCTEYHYIMENLFL